MPRKVYLKLPPPARTMSLAQIVLGVLFLPFGIVFVIVSEGEARPFAAIFSLLWAAGCIALIVHAVKVLQLIKEGKIEIAELGAATGEAESGFAARLRELEELKKDSLLSDEEYQRKRAEIMQEKW